MRKILFSLFFIFFFILFSFSSQTVFANTNFTASYDTTYTIDNNGITHALFRIGLTNQTTQYFASSYKIKIGISSIANVLASDDGGKITPTLTKTAEGQTITLTFNKKIVGKGKTTNFILSFDTNEIAQKQGSIWEVNIPGMKDQKDFEKFTVHVKPPDLFGPPTYIKPDTNSPTLDFTKEQLGKGGVSLAFGDKQYYSFSLVYHIENPYFFPRHVDIALPTTTNYQTVTIDSLNPRPENVIEDTDGNWIATYALAPSQKYDITANGRIFVKLYPETETLSSRKQQEYIQPKPYWENNEKILQLAQKLKTPEAIYAYVVNHLTYDFTRVTGNSPRLGAAGVLENPSSAVCLEFTDLFVALARAANIPAREIDGFGYTQNTQQRPVSLVKDILHAWPEYYDAEKKAWIMIDPTWGNTTSGIDYFHTLDFDHVAFVTKGAKSDLPVPAGGYKTKKFADAKDITVTFTDPFEIPLPSVKVHTKFPKKTTAGTPFTGSLLLTSEGGVSFPSQNITVTTKDLSPTSQKINSVVIPPFGTAVVPIYFHAEQFLTNKTADTTIQVNKESLSETIAIQPFFQTYSMLTGGILFGSITIFIFFIAQRARRIPFFR